MENESLVALVTIVAIVGIVALGFVTILATFCYRQENIHLFGRHKNKADIKGEVQSETEWEYDSTKITDKAKHQDDKSDKSSKNENDRKDCDPNLSNSNL